MICPDCKGSGLQPIAFPHNKDVCAITCTRCEGGQRVSDNTPKWIEMGKQLKEKRISKRLTLRKVCIQLDLDPVDVSKMERGCVEPDMSLYNSLED